MIPQKVIDLEKDTKYVPKDLIEVPDYFTGTVFVKFKNKNPNTDYEVSYGFENGYIQWCHTDIDKNGVTLDSLRGRYKL